MKNKNYDNLFLFVVVVVISIFLKDFAQNFALVIGLMIFNQFLGKRFSSERKIIVAINAIIIIYSIFIYWQYNNAVTLGFKDGIYHGIINNQLYTDTNDYYYESVEVVKIFTGPDLPTWLTGDYPHFGYYGPYHIQNILVALEMILIGENIISLILLKMIFTVLTFYLIYYLSKYYFNVNDPLKAIILFSAFPGYILVSTSLMRDNMLVFFIALSFLLYQKYILNGKFTFRHIIAFLIVIVHLFLLRLYSLTFILGMLILYYFKERRKVKRNAVIVIIIGGGVLSAYYLFATSSGVRTLINSFLDYDAVTNNWLGNKTQGSISIIYALYSTIIGYVSSYIKMPVFVVAEFWDYTGRLFLNLILLINSIYLFRYFLREKNNDRLFIVLFCLVVPFIICLAHTIALGATIVRIYNMWLWIMIIFVVKAFEKSSVKWREFKMLSYVLVTIVINVVWNLFR
jgi:4-amino-4-deoxy-L-arabinose transferase-like glycosyltransferase